MLRRSSYGFGVFHRKRARFKQQTRSSFRVNSSILPPPFDGSVPLDSFAPSVAGFASGFAVFLSSRLFGRRRSIDDDNIVVGEWILLTTPTPFNRFVLLRCSSLLSFDDSSESLSDRLVTDERHFVTSDTGKITVSSPDEKTPLEYQRVCITTEDGGVVSLDWPANLDIKEERGMDTTVIFIPGTPQGSMDEGVRSFVCEALRRGLFPVVMNPRGCAGSPLTTPRLFTAGDSDDVSTALRFLTKTRPWTTLAAVGRGYGANMLTKYLAEAGERSPLSAAVCIDNPFDLEEITRTSPYSTSLDQRITGGLVEILLANKELFQGRAKAFDVGKALSSKSVREFDTALSMVTYGCESIEDFYSSCATRDVIGEVKVPVLFIQNDNVVPPYTIPRSSIAENPYTSLLLCSSSPNLIDGRTLAVSWCQDLAIEWLTAVELALLKGRHPLLKDVDVTVNPSKGLVFSEARAPEKSIGAKKLVQAAQEKTVNGYHVDPFKETLEDSDITPNSNLSTGTDLEKNVKVDNGSDETENSSVSSSSLVEVESIEDNESNVEESERGQVLQTAEVVVNMLDVTMPGTLKDEEKKKVMDAVGRGETVLTALQDAVPEDVRGKITTAVTGILESGGTKLNLEKLKLPRISPGLKKAEEAKEEPSSAIDQKDSHSPNPIDKSDGLVSGSDDTITGSDNSPGGIELEHSPTEVSQKDGDSGNSQPVDSDQDDSLGNHESYTNEKNSAADGSENASEAKSDSANQGPIGTEDVTSNDDKVEQGSGVDTLQRQVETKKHDEKEAPIAEEKSSVADAFEKASDTKNDSINPPPVVVDDITSDGDKVDQAAVLSQQQRKEETNKNNDKEKQSATDQDKVTSTDNEGDAGKSSASQPVEKDISDDQSKETKIMQPVSDQTNPAIQEPNQSKFDVSHAFEALTGMDDETQVAVNSVFGVLENMISQLDEENKEGNEVSDEKNLKDTKTLKDEKNVTNEAMSPSEEEIPDKRETESLMPSENSHDPACSVSETEKSSGNDKVTGEMIEKDLGRDEFVNGKHSSKVLPERNTDSVENSSHDGYRGYRGEKLSKEKIAKQLDLDTTTALMLDYYPEEGEWKLLDQQPEHLDNDYYPEAGKWKLLDQQPEYLGNLAENAAASRDTHGNVQVHSLSVGNEDNIIEPAYVILDHGQESELSEMHDATDNQNDGPHKLDEGCKELEHLIKVIVSDSLNVEVQRRMGSAGMRQIKSQLSKDIRMVAKTFSYSVVYAEPTWTFIRNSKTSNGPSGKVGKLHGDAIIRAIASAVQEAHFLRQVLPIGVVVGSVLAALRKYFDVSTTTNSAKRDIVPGRTQKYENNGAAKRVLPDKVSKETQQNNSTIGEMVESGLQNINNEGVMVSDNGATTSVVPSKVSKESKQNNSTIGEMVESGLQSINNEGVMVGAVTAALGASAMLAQDEDPQRGGFMSKPSDSQHTESGKLDQSNMVASFAEKAMSIAGPAVPTKETGEVDQDRIVAMLADLGQRGGILKLVGKLALLWGGLRGAMSLTDKLIQFLRMDEWPLLKRAVGFIGMLLVLWSPVVIPLLPTLLQSWSTSNPSRVAELASVVGLYVAIFILVMLWGKRVRKYENPFMQYGLDFKASVKVKIQVFLKAFAGGMTVVLLIQFVNAILGAAIFSRPPYFPHPFDAMKCLKGCGQLLMLIVRGFTAATFVVLVEELLFRSWMPDEIAIDLGYHQSIIITGFIFALFQRSLRSIPGLWLLSLALAGARTRSQGNLIVPIGLRAGTIATSFLLQSGGFLFYNPSSPAWIAGSRPLQPFSGVVGLVVSLALALILYPRHSPETKLQKYN